MSVAMDARVPSSESRRGDSRSALDWRVTMRRILSPARRRSSTEDWRERGVEPLPSEAALWPPPAPGAPPSEPQDRRPCELLLIESRLLLQREGAGGEC